MEGNKLRMMMVSIGTSSSGSQGVERTAVEVDAPEGVLPMPTGFESEDDHDQGHPACRGQRGTILKGGEGPLEVTLPDRDTTLQQVDDALGRMQKIRTGTTTGSGNSDSNS